MRRKAFLTMVALTLLACGATGAWAADAAPFGYFGGFDQPLGPGRIAGKFE